MQFGKLSVAAVVSQQESESKNCQFGKVVLKQPNLKYRTDQYDENSISF